MSKNVPTDVVGEKIPASIGPLDTELTIHSYQHEWTTVTYKQNVVHVEARASGSTRRGGVLGRFRFTVTENEWRRLNDAVRTDGGRSVGTGTEEADRDD